jgi:hypothetical protein
MMPLRMVCLEAVDLSERTLQYAFRDFMGLACLIRPSAAGRQRLLVDARTHGE